MTIYKVPECNYFDLKEYRNIFLEQNCQTGCVHRSECELEANIRILNCYAAAIFIAAHSDENGCRHYL